MDYLYSGEIEANNAVTDTTHADKKRTWERWVTWLAAVGWIGDPYLTRLERDKKVRVVGAFGISIRRGEHSSARYTEPLVAGTVNKAISNLATSFSDNDHPDPRLNTDGKIHRHITSISKSFKRSDPQEKAQKAVTPMLLKHLFTRKDNFSKHIADLINGAFFFACRSCEYSKVTGTRKTKIITIRNIRFRKGNRILKYRTQYHTADSVSITFINQKNEMNYETVTQHKNSQTIQNPVNLWCSIVNRILDTPGTTIDSPVNTFFNPSTKRIEYITSDQILKSLRWAAGELGFDRLGYHPEDIGCHSIRSGAAMAMYLSPKRVPTYTIMLQGRWCSDAFLRYIRKQVAEFSIGVSEAMICKDTYSFFTTPDCCDEPHDEDPRLPNNPRSLTSSFNGNNAASVHTRNHIFE